MTPQQETFLKTLANSGNVSFAAKETGIDRNDVYIWRLQSKEFAEAFLIAEQRGIDAMEDEVHRRAFRGIDKPIFHQGVGVATVTEYSDSLAMFILKGKRPGVYADLNKTEHSGAVTLQVITGLPAPGEDLV